MRILIIEDDEAIARVLQRGLRAHGHQTVLAETGEDGVLLATDETVELIILDISLPGLNGHQVLDLPEHCHAVYLAVAGPRGAET